MRRRKYHDTLGEGGHRWSKKKKKSGHPIKIPPSVCFVFFWGECYRVPPAMLQWVTPLNLRAWRFLQIELHHPYLPIINLSTELHMLPYGIGYICGSHPFQTTIPPKPKPCHPGLKHVTLLCEALGNCPACHPLTPALHLQIP